MCQGQVEGELVRRTKPNKVSIKVISKDTNKDLSDLLKLSGFLFILFGIWSGLGSMLFLKYILTAGVLYWLGVWVKDGR